MTGQSAVRILVVEDDYLAASDVQSTLIEANFNVVGVASSAEEAIRLAQSERPEIIIMDIRLLGVRDGVDAALEIFRERGIRCIFATAYSDAQMRARAHPAKPLAWLAKPYTPHALIAAVRAAISDLQKPS